MPQFDTVIKNGLIIGGTRMPRFSGDLGIKNARIQISTPWVSGPWR
jgi:N-acyl-D-aspartate/D-glutamate deacylase